MSHHCALQEVRAPCLRRCQVTPDCPLLSNLAASVFSCALNLTLDYCRMAPPSSAPPPPNTPQLLPGSPSPLPPLAPPGSTEPSPSGGPTAVNWPPVDVIVPEECRVSDTVCT